MRRLLPALAAAALLLGAAGQAAAEVFVLTNGDRITGKRVRAGKRAFIVQTEFGRLTIPRARVERIVKDDGTEEIVNAPPSPEPVLVPAPPEPTARLVLIVVGKSFWHAWDPKEAVDATLRLDVRIDGEPLAAYADIRLDPQDLPGATVNTFSFLAGEVEMDGAAGIALLPPEVRPGRASLKIDIPFPEDATAPHQLEVAYMVNDGTAEEPRWRDVAKASTTVTLSPAAPAFLLLRQDPGKMEYSGFTRRRMKNVDTFKLELTSGT